MKIRNIYKDLDLYFRPYIYGKVRIGTYPWDWHQARISRKTGALEHWHFTWTEPQEWDCARDFEQNKNKYKRVVMPFGG
jgi:hypothetical protein